MYTSSFIVGVDFSGFCFWFLVWLVLDCCLLYSVFKVEVNNDLKKGFFHFSSSETYIFMLGAVRLYTPVVNYNFTFSSGWLKIWIILSVTEFFKGFFINLIFPSYTLEYILRMHLYKFSVSLLLFLKLKIWNPLLNEDDILPETQIL